MPNKGTTGTIFITSLVWCSPRTSHTRSQHSTTRLSRRWSLVILIFTTFNTILLYRQHLNSCYILLFASHESAVCLNLSDGHKSCCDVQSKSMLQSDHCRICNVLFLNSLNVRQSVWATALQYLEKVYDLPGRSKTWIYDIGKIDKP